MNTFSLPKSDEAERIVNHFPDDELRELSQELLKSSLAACETGDLIALGASISDWIATAEEYSLGPENVREIVKAREEMRSGDGAVDDGPLHIHIMTDADVEAQIVRYEKELGMDRVEFKARLKEGNVPDTFAAKVLEGLLRQR